MVEFILLWLDSQDNKKNIVYKKFLKRINSTVNIKKEIV